MKQCDLIINSNTYNKSFHAGNWKSKNYVDKIEVIYFKTVVACYDKRTKILICYDYPTMSTKKGNSRLINATTHVLNCTAYRTSDRDKFDRARNIL